MRMNFGPREWGNSKLFAPDRGSGGGGSSDKQGSLVAGLDKKTKEQEQVQPSYDVAFSPEEVEASKRVDAWLKNDTALLERYKIRSPEANLSMLQKAVIFADFILSPDTPVPAESSQEYKDVMMLLSNDMVLPKVLTVVGNRLMREFKQGPSFEKFDDHRANILEQRKSQDLGSVFSLDDIRSAVKSLTTNARLEDDQKIAIEEEVKIREAERKLMDTTTKLPDTERDALRAQVQESREILRERKISRLEKDLEDPSLSETQRAVLVKKIEDTQKGHRDNEISVSQELVQNMVLRAMNSPDDADKSLRSIYGNFRTEKSADVLRGFMASAVADVQKQLLAGDGLEEYQRKYIAEYLLPLILDEETLSESKRTETQQKRDRITRIRNIAWILQSHGVIDLDVDDDGMLSVLKLNADWKQRIKDQAVLFFANKPDKGRDLGNKELPAYIQNLALSEGTKLFNLFSSLRAPRRLRRSHNLPRSMEEVDKRIKDEDIAKGRAQIAEAPIDISKLSDPLDVLWMNKKMSTHQRDEIQRNINTLRKNDEPRLGNLEKSLPDIDALLQRINTFIQEQEAFVGQKKVSGEALTDDEIRRIRSGVASMVREAIENVNAIRRYRNEVDKRIDTFANRIQSAGGPRAAQNRNYSNALKGIQAEYLKFEVRHSVLDTYITRDKQGKADDKNLDVTILRLRRVLDLLPPEQKISRERQPRRERIGRRKFTSERAEIMSTALAIDLRDATEMNIPSGIDKVERKGRISLYTDMRYQIIDHMVRAGYPKIPENNPMREGLVEFFRDDIASQILSAPAELFMDMTGKDVAERARIQGDLSALRVRLQDRVNEVIETLKANPPQKSK